MSEAASLQETAPGVGARRTARLWAEFLILFLGMPLAMATVLSDRHPFAVLGVMTLVGLALLAVTPGFRWRSLLPSQALGRHWRATAVFLLGASGLIYAVTHTYLPHRLFAMPLYNERLWLMIMALYPIFSALPQELLYRSLFFERYGVLFGGHGRLAILVNGLCFGLAHLFFYNPVAILLSTLGGVAFAYAYVTYRSFPLAFLWHSLAGQLVFTIGLGLFFYHGAIGR